MAYKKILAFALSLLGLPLFAQGETGAPAPATPTEKPPLPVQDYGLAFFKMLMMLLALLAIVLLTVWIIKRWGYGRMGKFKDKQGIHVLERRVLSPKTVLYTIEIEGARILIAESQLEVRALYQCQATPEES